jgi:hypothetical protein
MYQKNEIKYAKAFEAHIVSLLNSILGGVA